MLNSEYYIDRIIITVFISIFNVIGINKRIVNEKILFYYKIFRIIVHNIEFHHGYMYISLQNCTIFVVFKINN